MASSSDVRAQLLHWQVDDLLWKGTSDSSRHARPSVLSDGCTNRRWPYPLLGIARTARNWMELQLHRCDGDGKRVPQRRRTRESPRNERFLRFCDNGNSLFPRRFNSTQLWLERRQLDDSAGPSLGTGSPPVEISDPTRRCGRKAPMTAAPPRRAAPTPTRRELRHSIDHAVPQRLSRASKRT